MRSSVHEHSESAIETRSTPAGVAPVETRDGLPPPPADGAAHPDHRATDAATDPPSADAATRGRGAIAPGGEDGCCGRGPWPAWRSGDISWSPRGTMLDTVSTDDAYVNGYVTLVAPRVPGQVARVLVHDNYRVKKGDLLVQLDREPYQVQVDLKKAAVVNAEADLQGRRGPGPGHPGTGRQPEVETPEVDGRCRRLGRAPGRTGGGPEEQGSDLRSRTGRPAAGPEASSARHAISREEFDQHLEAERTAEAAVKQALRKSMRRGSPSACPRAPRRES